MVRFDVVKCHACHLILVVSNGILHQKFLNNLYVPILSCHPQRSITILKENG